ncbi:phospholipase D-like domain-containing protein [Dongia deserti]|uniref:phospholipase D-like domain-containing protein n=1 Tax=Dongia deserti TaxID=2268030 RepID=UPI000E64FD67|nr:phospholipase D-like domain-containing protein [Dongia deserti]
MTGASLLRPGQTCWRIERANRIAFLIDAEAYFAAVKALLRNARHSILLLGWEFDPRTRLEPGAETKSEPDAIGPLLLDLKKQRPELDIHVLIWDMAILFALTHYLYPQRAEKWFEYRLAFRLDSSVPFGACHHQKVLVIDDAVAFCGGGDFAPNRWDTPSHPDDHPARRLPSGRAYEPRHDVTMMVDGAAAGALGDLARARWQRATGEVIKPPERCLDDPWPATTIPALTDVHVAIARTEPAWRGRPSIRENEALYLGAIAAARCLIVLENQYFASPLICAALKARLSEPDGPEVVVICSGHSPSLYDFFSMDRTRDALIPKLARADAYDRFRAYAPLTSGGRVIVVHSKVALIDDRFLRIGSANLNNRSFGYDTECDLAIEADDRNEGKQSRQAIEQFRNYLIAHYLGSTTEHVSKAVESHGSLIEAIEALDKRRERRLRPFERTAPSLFGRVVAEWSLGDPISVADAWRPWRRPTAQHVVDGM